MITMNNDDNDDNGVVVVHAGDAYSDNDDR